MTVYFGYLIHRILIDDHYTWSQDSPDVSDTTEVVAIPPRPKGMTTTIVMQSKGMTADGMPSRGKVGSSTYTFCFSILNAHLTTAGS